MPHTRRARDRLAPAARRRVTRAPVVARAPAALLELAQRLAEAAPARALARPWIAPAATRAVIVRRAVVVSQPEEPDKPDHEQPDIEDAETNHEDPTLSGHHLGS